MARRISLPSSDELFSDRGPYAGRAEEPAHRRPRTARAARPAAPAPRTRATTARIDRVEKRLRELPIDTLLELRDGLEALLLRDTLTEADVEGVLATTGG